MSSQASIERKVSVVMPAFNAARTIAEAIDSVLGQSHSNFELIVVADGSTDKTSEQVRLIRDPRVRLLHIPNSGPAAARNRGIRAATGAYVAFLDADDVWLPEKLVAQLAALDANPAAGAVYGFVDEVDAEGGRRKPLTRQVAEGRILETLLVWNVNPRRRPALIQLARRVENRSTNEQVRAHRIPCMRDYEKGEWFDYPAAYISSDGNENRALYSPPAGRDRTKRTMRGLLYRLRGG